MRRRQTIDPAERFLKRIENHINRMAVEYRKTGSSNYESHMRLIVENLRRLDKMTMSPERKLKFMTLGWELYQRAQECNYPERLQQVKTERAEWIVGKSLSGSSMFKPFYGNSGGTNARYYKEEEKNSPRGVSLVGKYNIPPNPPKNNEIWQKGYGFLLGEDPNGGWKIVSTAKAEKAGFDKSCSIPKQPIDRRITRAKPK